MALKTFCPLTFFRRVVLCVLVEIVFGWFDAAIKVKKTIDESKDNISRHI